MTSNSCIDYSKWDGLEAESSEEEEAVSVGGLADAFSKVIIDCYAACAQPVSVDSYKIWWPTWRAINDAWDRLLSNEDRANLVSAIFDRTRQFRDVLDLLVPTHPDFVCEAMVSFLCLLTRSSEKVRKALLQDSTRLCNFIVRVLDPEFQQYWRASQNILCKLLRSLSQGRSGRAGLIVFGNNGDCVIQALCHLVITQVDDCSTPSQAVRVSPLMTLEMLVARTSPEKGERKLRDALRDYAWPATRHCLVQDPVPACWWVSICEFSLVYAADIDEAAIHGHSHADWCAVLKLVYSSGDIYEKSPFRWEAYLRQQGDPEEVLIKEREDVNCTGAEEDCFVRRLLCLLCWLLHWKAIKCSDIDHDARTAIDKIFSDARAQGPGFTSVMNEFAFATTSGKAGRQFVKKCAAAEANKKCNFINYEGFETSKCGNTACSNFEAHDHI